MSFAANRLRMLLQQCEAASQDGWLTQEMLDDVRRETMALHEPAASDLRNLLQGVQLANTPAREMGIRLRQAQTILNLENDYT